MIIKSINDALLKKSRHIHFIGIGGSGMLPIVQILHSMGYEITGSDNNPGDNIDLERSLGIDVTMGQKAENINGADLIVYSAAIMNDNPELIAAEKSNIPCLERGAMLGYLSGKYQNAVCIAGTHGKTTTSGMTAQILLDAKCDPTAVLGGCLPSIGGNGRIGKSDIFVIEACEYKDTFLKLKPDISVILNIDEDHMEYFKTLDNLKHSFRIFANSASKCVIACGDDANTMDCLKGIDKPVITFGFGEHNDYYADKINMKSDHENVVSDFTVYKKGNALVNISLGVPGEYNILNALAAVAASDILGVLPDDIATGLGNFHGTGRRFQIMGTVNGATVADDYAHHPTELKAVLSSAKKMGFKKIWAIFQPFTFSRTARHLSEFGEVLQIANEVLLTQIMGSREKNTYNIYSSDLAEKIPNAIVFDSFEEIAKHIKENVKEDELVLTLGCGDIYKVAKLIVS